MKTFCSILFITVILSPTIYGCVSHVNERHVIIPVEQPQVFEVTINEKITTEKDVIDALGMPESVGSNFRYNFDDGKNYVSSIL